MNYALPMVALAVGTLGFRLLGPMLRSRVTISPRVETLSSIAVAVVFLALITTSALVVNNRFGGIACPTGVLVAAILAWRKAPFFAIVLAAAGTTAALRLLGIA